MAIRSRTRSRTAAEIMAVRQRVLDRPGLLLKRLVLIVGAVYFGMVCVTNTVDFIAAVGGFHWTFLNSGERDLHRLDHQGLFVAELDD